MLPHTIPVLSLSYRASLVKIGQMDLKLWHITCSKVKNPVNRPGNLCNFSQFESFVLIGIHQLFMETPYIYDIQSSQNSVSLPIRGS